MKKMISLLLACVLSLFTFYSTCWFSPNGYFNFIIPIVYVAIFAYILFMYLLYHRLRNLPVKIETCKKQDSNI
ncbi:MAG: hypothetical protein ACC612_09840 [Methanomethylovorans sp.]|uniref:hypothetical protein n=1 Tax=Methanomethylovorans sp. TaxID=2758717 RepID=UPI0035316126